MKSIVLIAVILRIILITAIISFTIIVHAQSIVMNTTGNSVNARVVVYALVNL